MLETGIELLKTLREQVSRERPGVGAFNHADSSFGNSIQPADSSLLMGSWSLSRVDGRDLPAIVWPEQGAAMVLQVEDNLELLPEGAFRSSANYKFICPLTGKASTAAWEVSGSWKAGSRIQFRTFYGASYTGQLNERVLVVQRASGTYEYVRQIAS